MRRLTIVAMALATIAALPAASEEPPEGPVWFWLATCGGPLMRLELELHGETVFSATVPLCRAERSSAHTQGEQARLHFRIQPAREIVWSGYTDEDQRTAPGESIEVDLWEAGADSDGVVVGITFRRKDTILMNSLHILNLLEPSTSAYANGVVLETRPGKPER